MPLVSAVFFDLDGTLVDSSADISNAANVALRWLGLPPRSTPEVMAHVGRGALQLLSSLTERDPSTSPELQEAVQIFIRHYEQEGAAATTLYPGVAWWLEQLASLPLAVVSNKPVVLVEKTLDHLGLRGYFRQVLGGDSLPKKKPDPLPLLTTLQALGLQATEVVMVGDSPMDIEAGQAAGTWTCGVSWGFGRPSPSKPHAYIDTPQQFFSTFQVC